MASRAKAFGSNARKAAGVAACSAAFTTALGCGWGNDAGALDGGPEASSDATVTYESGPPVPYNPPDSSVAFCDGSCTDFPPTPLNDPAGPVPGDPSTLFPGDGGTGTTKNGPCLSEPANGALYPYNWLHPRVFWTAPANQTSFEVRVSAPGEKNDYVVYTTNHDWTLDEATWQKIAGIEGGATGTLVGIPISFVVRGTSGAGETPTISNTAEIEIAPASTGGAIVYLAAASGIGAASTTLERFRAGDDATSTLLTVPQVQQEVWAEPPDGGSFPNLPVLEPVGCIGCHAMTPDGTFVGFTAQWPWPNVIASIQASSPGATPPWLTPGAMANLNPNANDSNSLGGANVTATNDVDDVMLGMQTFSSAHFATGDRVEVTSLGASMDDANDASATATPACQGGTGPCVVSELAWIDLEWDGGADAGARPSAAPAAPTNGGWGILARKSDGNSAGAPDWSHDGKTIAYTSVSQGVLDGRLSRPSSGSADIKTIPYAAKVSGPGGAGGQATPLRGASNMAYNEYYPAFSPDDALIAFNRIPASATMYAQPLAELYVVPYNGGDGGTPMRLVANDPVACTGLTSPGVQNTWAKWAPNAIGRPDAGASAPQTIAGLTYYWVAFSSSRSVAARAAPGMPGKQQLYMAGIVVDAQGNIRTFAPIYMWNQDPTVDNLMPAWNDVP